MVSSKNHGFQVSECRPESRSTERIKLDDDGRSERPFLKSERRKGYGVAEILETDADCAGV
jgi:hypothetical protein